ncbi:FxSxx-COOH system tetratricopeptide repeat protein [Nocardia ignorata]|uniref:FxSxx-COOH system tetratricopeptide repeat protein n=1 Tax=Nocardia ignorata TaxID=145285 RepID=UPI00362E8DE9
MKWFGSRRKRSDEAPGQEPVVRAAGDRAAAVGGNAGVIQTGDNSQVVLLPPEALRPVSEVEAPPGIDNLPLRPGRFVGRADELDRLDVVLNDPGQVVVQAVHGLGGIGKSTLVAQWAATRAHRHSPIVWISADTATTVQQGLADFAAALQPVLAQTLDAEQLAERALQWLATHHGWLLILDNVDDFGTVAEVLARARTGRVVLTSRRSSGWQPGTAVVRLDTLEPEESLSLLLAILQAAGPRDTDGAAELCCELGHLPLAVEQAGAYLAQNPFTTPRNYLRLLAEKPSEMHRRAAIGTDPERTVAQIWRVTINRITTVDPRAADLLCALAWYGPDAIPMLLCENIVGAPALGTSVGVLAAYCMITPDPDTNSVSIHRLVQAVARTPELDRNPDAIQFAHSVATSAMEQALPAGAADNPQSWPTWRALLPHIEALVTHTIYDTTKTARILVAAAYFLVYTDQHARGRDYLQRAVFVREQLLGTDHPDTLNARTALGEAYEADGQFAEAITLFERNRADTIRVLGTDHPDAIRVRHYLARAYGRVGRIEDGITLHEQTLADRERVLGIDHSETRESRHVLTFAYLSSDRIEEAIALGERNLIDIEGEYGRDHPRYLASRHNLASAYEAAGRLSEAIPLYEQNVTDAAEVLSADHPDVAPLGEALADAYRAAGRFTEAIAQYEQNLADYARTLGASHEKTLIVRSSLAETYLVADRIEDGIALYEQNLTENLRAVGNAHERTITAREALAGAYKAANRIDEVIILREQNLAACEDSLSVAHIESLAARNNLADAYLAANRAEDVIGMYARTPSDPERIIGAEHPDILIYRNNLAVALQMTGRFDEAIRLHTRNVAVSERIFGPDDVATGIYRRNLARARHHAAPPTD